MPLQWIVFAALLIAFAIFAAVTTYWQDIVAQPPSAAAFLGALAGAGGGLLAIILGALVNAELNRRRDDRLRRNEAKSIGMAISGQLDVFANHCKASAVTLRLTAPGEINIDKLKMLEFSDWTVFDATAAQIGLIGTELPDGVAVMRRVLGVRQSASTSRTVFRSFFADPELNTLSGAEVSRLVVLFDLAGERAGDAARMLRQAIGVDSGRTVPPNPDSKESAK